MRCTSSRPAFSTSSLVTQSRLAGKHHQESFKMCRSWRCYYLWFYYYHCRSRIRSWRRSQKLRSIIVWWKRRTRICWSRSEMDLSAFSARPKHTSILLGERRGRVLTKVRKVLLRSMWESVFALLSSTTPLTMACFTPYNNLEEDVSRAFAFICVFVTFVLSGVWCVHCEVWLSLSMFPVVRTPSSHPSSVRGGLYNLDHD